MRPSLSNSVDIILFCVYSGDLEIVDSSMMQTREYLASWQREV